MSHKTRRSVYINRGRVLIEAAIAYANTRGERSPNTAYETRRRFLELTHDLVNRRGRFQVGYFTEDKIMFAYKLHTVDIVVIPPGEHEAYREAIGYIRQALDPQAMMSLN